MSIVHWDCVTYEAMLGWRQYIRYLPSGELAWITEKYRDDYLSSSEDYLIVHGYNKDWPVLGPSLITDVPREVTCLFCLGDLAMKAKFWGPL